MKDLFTSLQERLSAETPGWFKNIAWASGMIAGVCVALVAAQLAEQISLSPEVFEWMKRIAIACGAVAGVSVTAKKT